MDRYSRHRFSEALLDSEGRRFLSPPEPFRYRALPDTREHRVVTGDTLWGLADLYFQPLEQAAELWWVIADFQPDPIHDPTLPLEGGRTLLIPSRRTLEELVFNERRRREASS